MLQKLIIVAVVAFLGFWLFTDPHGLARATHSGADHTWEASTDFFRAVIQFIHAL